MSEQFLSNGLLQEALDYYKEINQLDCVNKISSSIPILFFGDIKNYLKNDFKIVTAALNPSVMEFKDGNQFSLFRFKDYDGSLRSLELSWSKYFENNPYENWFGKRINGKKGFKPVLNGIGYCYYNDLGFKNVLHTDICSPVATYDVWGKLNFKEQKILMDKGKSLWTKTIKELKPNLILYSGKPEYLDGFTIKEDINKTHIISKIDKRFEFRKLIIDDFTTSILIGPNSRFGPYGASGLDGDLKVYIGNIIKEIFQIISPKFDKSLHDKNRMVLKSNLSESENNIIEKTYFILKKSYLGKNHTIRFTDKNENVIEYNHDKVLNQLGKKITNLNCWHARGFYSNSKGVPKFAQGLESIKYLK